MSRSSAQRQQQKQHAQELLVQPQSDPAAAAAEYFDMFCQTTTMRQVLGLHRNMCDVLGLRPSPLNEFYPKVKEKIKSWKAQALWKKFDARAAHRVYGKGNACTGTRVLVIGAGPCGLRTAIEAQLLGAKVVVVEKRDRISRNNVLHLWPFVITDLRNLGAKKFYGKFCAGSIDHISIRQLQCILLKVALLLGVEVHEGVSFENTIEPSDGCGWRAAISPADHVVSHYEFDVLIGADGKRNTLEGFRRKEFRGKLAIAITANFVNRKTEAEAKAEEISGVAFIFNQSFFKELYHTTGIDLENIVYYKDETHYFVMTAKKHSLIDKGVIMQDCADPAELLSPANVNTEKLLDYAREAAEFSTKYQMPNLDFAVNHYGKPDVAMFDFTSMFAAETSCRVTVRKGYRLLQCLVGDSLLEPFWPTGSGCARGFLSSMDAAYTIKLWANPRNCTLGVLAQRESIYRLLGQTTPENLQRDIGAYTMDPATRYPNLNRTSVNIWQVKHLIDTDDPSILEQTFMDTNALQDKTVDTPVRRKRRSGDTMPLSTILLRWICAQLHSYEFIQELKEVSDIFTNGKVLCALINRYRPDLVDLNSVKSLSPIECNELAFTILEEEMNIPRIMSGKDSMQLNNTDSKVWLNYLEQICEVFRGEIPHVKHPKMDVTELREKYRINHRHVQPDFSKLLQISSKQKPTIAMQDSVDVPQNVQRRSVLDEDKLKRHRKLEAAQAAIAASGSTPGAQADTPRRAKKRRNVEKSQNLEERQKRLEEIEQNRVERQSRRRQQRYQQTQNFYKSLHMLQANTLLRESDSNEPFEDYSIFLYRQQAPEFNDRVKELERKLLFPDRERSDIPSALPRGATDEQFNDRIKSMEQRMSARTAYGTDKKPKDLMRAIGKIDSSDWNVREIEKKIEQAKKTEIHGPMGREKVPKWSKEQFMARQNKMAKPTRQDSSEEKFKEIDRTIKNLDKQLKEGNVLEVGERGRNKVASIAGQFVRKEDNQMSDDKNPSVQKSSSKVALAFKKQAASEKCHFCKQTVYLMEKTIAEDLTFHRACLKCHHCHTSLRMGGYAFDRDDPNGRFYCTQHFRLPAKAIRPVVRKSGQRKPTQQQLEALAANAANSKLDDAGAVVEDGEAKTPEKLRGHTDSVAQLDLLDRGQTPERIEFENADAMSDGEPSEEHIIDEHEWSGRNFLPESNNDSESDLSSSDDSESETDSDIFEEVNDSPLGAQTLQLATDWIGKQNYTDSDDSDDFYDSSEGIADDGKDDTEGEEFKKARELRREEVRLLPLPPNLPTDTETEVQTESESTSPDEVELNSATEISTDSEFDHDEIIREAPKIFIDDTHLRKPTKVQMKSVAKYVPTTKDMTVKGTSYLQKYQTSLPQPVFKPLVQVDPSLLISNRDPLQNPRPGDYLLNKTASTEGIASKKSLELKKRYLLGEAGNGNEIQKSGSTSVLDSRIRSFQSNISECQKLLNPNSDISSNMKTLLDRTKMGTGAQNELMRSATNNILNDLKVEITIQKASSTASTDNEKENVYVNSKNELNKGLEYSETVNNTLVETMNKKSPATPTNKQIVIESIDLVTPEKKYDTIDLTAIEEDKHELNSWTPDSNKIIDLTCESPVDNTIIEDCKPDVSKHAKQSIPDLLGHIEHEVRVHATEEERRFLSQSGDEEKCDSPEKILEHFEQDSVQIKVPNIPWNKRKDTETASSTTVSSCTSSSSSIEDIQHYMLESTTSPETQASNNALLNGNHQVPRVEIHDSSGTLMQVDSLMIIDGKYIGDPEDLKYMQLPAGVAVSTVPQVPEVAVVKTTELEEDEVEPVTATPEPVECTVIETPLIDEKQAPSLPDQGPPLPERGPPKMKTVNLKFDTKNENKIESLKALPLIVEQTKEHVKAVKPITLNLSNTTSIKSQKTPESIKSNVSTPLTPTSPFLDNDKTPIADGSRGSEDSEGTEATQTGQLMTETELSDWTADDCISENFADMEFMVNTKKNTIKRNKKEKKKNGIKLPCNSEFNGKPAPVAEFEGILKSMNLDDIEFMDTGSEGSCAETYSATNTALLQNRGYVEFIETPKHAANYQLNNVPRTLLKYTPTNVSTKRDEKLGIDYIEQGAYIMDNLKTPVNEAPQVVATSDSLMSQSLTDSSTINDLDEDSLGVVTTYTRTANTNNYTTTEESDVLTVVTSPLESSPPKPLNTLKNSESTLSGSDKQARSSHSTSVSSSRATPPKSKQTDELSYEDYVRALQQKITQISSARGETLAKHKRKSSKGDEIHTTNISSASSALTSSSVAPTKVPEIPTLSSKLEEITKERNKQKDLIHDLVMDKLQSKKQLNAEKRLHRSRQRNLMTSGYSSGTSLSPTPKLAAASSMTDNSCSNKAHYHASTAAIQVEKEAKKENIPLQKSATYVTAYGMSSVVPPTRTPISSNYKQRPFSEHINTEQLDAFERFKLSKTPSFSYALSLSQRPLAKENDTQNTHMRTASVEKAITASTESLRNEARARARLKSNSELGLSPEEKMQLLRKRLYLEHGTNMRPVASSSVSAQTSPTKTVGERKISNSKSVCDLSAKQQQQQQNKVESMQGNEENKSKLLDFISDPNVLSGEGVKKTKTGRRAKDPERRKSLIQSLSNFFHKNSKDNGASHSAQPESTETSSNVTNAASSTANNNNNLASSAEGGMFSRFRISPKQKEKSKDKDMVMKANTTTTITAASSEYLQNAQGTQQQQQQQKYTNNNNQNKHDPNKKMQSSTTGFSFSSPQLYVNGTQDNQIPPPIPPLPLNYQRSDDESYANETREQKKQRAISKAIRQAELKRLRIAQEIQREQEEIEVQLKELEARGVLIEKALRGEPQNVDNFTIGALNDDKLLKELLEIWRKITQLKKRDEELNIRQQELQLEHRHAQLKEELNLRLSNNKLDKSSADVAAEGAILNEMLEIVAKRASLRPSTSNLDLSNTKDFAIASTSAAAAAASYNAGVEHVDCIKLAAREQVQNNEESII